MAQETLEACPSSGLSPNRFLVALRLSLDRNHAALNVRAGCILQYKPGPPLFKRFAQSLSAKAFRLLSVAVLAAIDEGEKLRAFQRNGIGVIFVIRVGVMALAAAVNFGELLPGKMQ